MTDEEIGLVNMVRLYGGGLDLSGPRIGRKIKTLAKGLLTSGDLVGTMQNLNLPQEGAGSAPTADRIPDPA